MKKQNILSILTLRSCKIWPVASFSVFTEMMINMNTNVSEKHINGFQKVVVTMFYLVEI